MNKKNIRLSGVTLLAGMLALAGCSDKSISTNSNEHAGQNHGLKGDAKAGVAQCAAHNAPAYMCFICDPALRDKNRLWCAEHNRYEDRCWECHPELRDTNREFCDGHGLYEDECFFCQPALIGQPGVNAAGGGSSAGLMCNEHVVLEAECGICRPEVAGQLQPGQSMKVRMPALDSARLVGVQTTTPSVGGIADGIECFAELSFNQNKLAQIVAPVGGIVQEVTVDLGSRVMERETVARLWSASIAEAVAKAVLSHQTLKREQRLHEQRVTSQQNLQEAEAAHRAACQQLSTLGFTEAHIDALGDTPLESVLLDVRAPFAGEIIERTAVRGALVESGKPLFIIADRSVMWAMLNIPESALVRVQPGQSIELRFDSIPGRTFTGTLTWVGAEVDHRSRMVQARAEVPNPDGLLRANMFARARLLTGKADGAMVLPASAMQQVEGRPMVFVKLADDLFEARAVRIGTRFNGQVEVLEGIKPREEVVVAQGFALKSQLLISRLGAGCAHE